MITQPSATLLDELLDPVGRCLTPEVARRIVRLRASPALDARIQELGRKCNEGQLSEREQADYETLARFVKFVSVLQSKARTILCESTGESTTVNCFSRRWMKATSGGPTRCCANEDCDDRMPGL